VTLPPTIKKIGSKSFCECKNLSDINFPAGIELIDDFAFSGCNSLRAPKLNRGLSKLGFSAFQVCDNLDSLSVPGSVEVVSDHTSHGSRVYTLRICSGVKKVSTNASLNNYYQKRIIIPPTVVEMEPYCVGYIYMGGYAGTTGAVIYGAKGSAAEKYAKENGMTFYEFDFRYGDLDQNGKVNAVDASLALAEYTLRSTGDRKGKLTGASELRADINDDFTVNAIDASRILQYYAASSSGSDYTPEEYFFCS
jgi:hypothetical protein